MTSERRPEELATALAGMARDLLAQETLPQTLDRIVTHAIDLVDGCEAAGIMVIRSGQVHTVAANGDTVHDSDRIQGEMREGPCFEVIRSAEVSFRIADMSATVDRWPHYAPRARELGIGSMIGFKLFTDEDALGALNLYSFEPEALTERSEQIGLLVASHAAVAFASARSVADLRVAISTRQHIGEAVGILMERHKLNEYDAFAMLAKASQDQNVKLREVARRVTETGEVLGSVARET